MPYKVRDADGNIIYFETSGGDGSIATPFKAAAAASLPLPTGAATETTLAAASAKLPASLGGKTGAQSLSVVPNTDTAFTMTLQPNAVVTDVASAAISATATTASFALVAGTVSQEFVVTVTAVSGTSQTMDVVVQESSDGGVTWFDVYHFQRITAAGSYRSPSILAQGTHVRYIQTIGGTTPSFTRLLGRVRSHKNTTYIRRFTDRTIAVNTLSAVSPTYDVEGANLIEMWVQMSAGQTTAPVITLQSSLTGLNGSWVTLGTVTTVVSGTVKVTVTDTLPSVIRAMVSVAGVAAVLDNITFVAMRK